MNLKTTNSHEIEVKLSLNDKELLHLQELMNSEEVEYLGNTMQEDYYLDNPNNSWIRTNDDGHRDALQYLRIRITPKHCSICYKDWRTNSGDVSEAGEYCHDNEIAFPASEQNKYFDLFHSLGFTDKTKVHKSRTSYLYKDYRIDIDTVENLGTFVEFEVINKKYNDSNLEYNRIIEFLQSIGLGDAHIQKQGFIVLLWNQNR